MKIFPMLFGVYLAFTLPGCGSGSAVPDQPATLTADQEQEILRQVQQASSAEQGQ